MSLRNRSGVLLAVFAVVVLAVATPAQAQRSFEPLFDKFNVSAQFSWAELNTEIGLDSETLGTGTTLNFEDDLDLDSNKVIPGLAFEWQIARKHRLGVRWQDISRDSSAQALTEIQWGDEIIPVNADITLAFDITQYFIDYTYYPWVKEKWAAGFGLGIRWMDLKAELRWQEASLGGGGDSIDQPAPLPYLYFEYGGSRSPSMMSAVAIMSAGRPSSICWANDGALAPPSTLPMPTSMWKTSKTRRATPSSRPASTRMSTTSASLRG